MSDEFDEIRQRFIAVPKDKVFSKRTISIGFLILAAPLYYTTIDTNIEIRDRKILEKENAKLSEENENLEEVSVEATDAVVLLLGILQEHGIEAPEIIIRAGD